MDAIKSIIACAIALFASYSSWFIQATGWVAAFVWNLWTGPICIWLTKISVWIWTNVFFPILREIFVDIWNDMMKPMYTSALNIVQPYAETVSTQFAPVMHHFNNIERFAPWLPLCMEVLFAVLIAVAALRIYKFCLAHLPGVSV